MISSDMLAAGARSAFAGAVLVMAAGIGSVHGQEAEAGQPRVAAVELRGVESVDGGALRAALATQPTRCRSVLVKPFCLISKSDLFVERNYLDRTELERDALRIRVFYWRRGWRDAMATATVRGSGDVVDVVFTVREGPLTTVASVDIAHEDSVLSPRDIRRAGLPRVGDPLNLLKLDTARVHLRSLLWEEGYADAVVRDTALVDDSLHTARVQVALQPGRRATVARIEVAGNEEIGRRTILNSIPISEGGMFRRSEVAIAQRSLYESSLFRQALIDVPEGQDSAKLVRITVREAPLRAARVTVGFNTVDFIQTEGGFTHYNWFGGARRLDLRATVGNLLAPQLNGQGIFRDVIPGGVTPAEADRFLRPTWTASAEVTQPWFRSPKNSLGVSVFAHRRTVPGIVIDRGYGASLSFTRRLAYDNPASLTYHFELTQVEAGDVYFCVNFGVCDLATIGALRGRQRLSPVTLTLAGTRTDDPLSPTDGYTYNFSAEHASSYTLSDYRYNRLTAEGARYIEVGGGVLAGRVRLGWVKPLSSTAAAVGTPGATGVVLHPRVRFYAGGSQSVRGYGENQLGPRILTIAPGALADTTLADPCTHAELEVGACDPGQIPSSKFTPRPLGGSTVIVANLEYRFPITGPLHGAVFVDAGSLSQSESNPFAGGYGAITPGFGIRYHSPVGAVRVDLGIRPALKERLPVVTEVIAENGERRIVRLENDKLFDPLEGASGIRHILDRLQLHLSIGQAF